MASRTQDPRAELAPRPRRTRGWVFALGSVALHVLWVVAMREPPRVAAPAAGAVVEIELLEQPAASEVAAVEQLPPPKAVEVPAAVRKAAPRRAPAEKAVATPEVARGEGVEHEQVHEHEHEQVQEQAAAPWVDLSPRRAVVGAYDALTKPRSCLPPAADRGATCVDEPQGELAQEQLNQAIKGTRMVPHLAARDAPVLHRESDGGYRYDGHVFTAKIMPDGLVRFADSGEALEVVDAREEGSDRAPMVGPSVRGRFDVMDKVERAMGKESYSAEKTWFLEQTSELRARLVAAARARERAAARRYVERELERILSGAELNAEQKRAQVFGIWQDCGDDGDSSDTRRVVEAFVRLHMPAGSALGFTSEELARWNAGRRGLTPFEPYRVPPVGGSPG